MERMNVAQHQVVSNVHHENIVQRDQVVVLVVRHDRYLIQHNVVVDSLNMDRVVMVYMNVEMVIH